MSLWSYVHGVLTVSPPGFTQSHKTYVLDTVLAHLPAVTGSEGNMDTYVTQCKGWNFSRSHDEFMNPYMYSPKSEYRDRGREHLQCNYLISVRGQLRDRNAEYTHREFCKWICRLAKRIMIDDVTVSITGDFLSENTKPIIITNEHDKFSNLFEWPPSDSDDASPAWTDFMMWESDKSGLPLELAYKYYQDTSLDAEMERRREYRFNHQSDAFDLD